MLRGSVLFFFSSFPFFLRCRATSATRRRWIPLAPCEKDWPRLIPRSHHSCRESRVNRGRYKKWKASKETKISSRPARPVSRTPERTLLSSKYLPVQIPFLFFQSKPTLVFSSHNFILIHISPLPPIIKSPLDSIRHCRHNTNSTNKRKTGKTKKKPRKRKQPNQPPDCTLIQFNQSPSGIENNIPAIPISPSFDCFRSTLTASIANKSPTKTTKRYNRRSVATRCG